MFEQWGLWNIYYGHFEKPSQLLLANLHQILLNVLKLYFQWNLDTRKRGYLSLIEHLLLLIFLILAAVSTFVVIDWKPDKFQRWQKHKCLLNILHMSTRILLYIFQWQKFEVQGFCFGALAFSIGECYFGKDTWLPNYLWLACAWNFIHCNNV